MYTNSTSVSSFVNQADEISALSENERVSIFGGDDGNWAHDAGEELGEAVRYVQETAEAAYDEVTSWV